MGFSESHYDADGHRVQVTALGETQDFIFDIQGRAVATVRPSDGVWMRGEVWSPVGHLATYRNGTTYFSHTDWLGTVRARSDASGALVETFTSLPFGDDLSGIGSSPVHFTGQERDDESKLDHFWFRQYASRQGRWMSPDPAGLAVADPTNPQSWNRYAYVINNPMNLVDPLGLDPADFWWGDCYYYHWLDQNERWQQGSICFRREDWKDRREREPIPPGFWEHIRRRKPPANNANQKPLCVTVFAKETVKSFGNLLPGKSDFAEMVNTAAQIASSIENIDPAQWLTQQITNWRTSTLMIPASKALRGGLSRNQWLSQATKQAAKKTGWQAFLFTLDYAMADALGKEISSFTSGQCRAIGYDD